MPKVTVTAIATEIVPANGKRLSVVLTNNGSDDITLGQDNSITFGEGPLLKKNGTFTEDSSGTTIYMGPIYGIADTGNSADIGYWERTR